MTFHPLDEAAAESDKAIRDAIYALFDQGYTYGQVLPNLSRTWRQWKEDHPSIVVKVRVPRMVIHSLKGDEIPEAKLRKVIEVPFDSLSPRAKKLYLEAISELGIDDGP